MAKVISRFKITRLNERFNVTNIINSHRFIVTDKFTDSQWMVETSGITETANMAVLNDTEWMDWLAGANAFNVKFSE